MMERRNRIDENLPQPMLSPMIDMIFLLLVFFIVSTMYMTELKTIPVKLPVAAHTENITSTTFAVTLKDDGSMYLNKEPVSTEILLEKVKTAAASDSNFSVVLRADKNVEYGLVIQLMDKLKGAGVTRFGLATEYGKK